MMRAITWLIDPEGTELRVLDELVALRDQRVLELGCGDGRLTLQYASATRSILAIDPNAERIVAARTGLPPERAETVVFAVASAEEVDAPRWSFDLALFSSSL